MAERFIEVRVTPRANADRLSVGNDGLVAVHVRAAPHDGAANEAVLRLLSKALKVPRTSLRIASGQGSRLKRVEIEGLSGEEAMRRLTKASGRSGT